MQDRQHFHCACLNPIDESMRRLVQLAHLLTMQLRDRVPRRLVETPRETGDRLLGVDRGIETDMLGERRELPERVLSPAHRERRTAAMADRAGLGRAATSGADRLECMRGETTFPASASASPASIDCRT